MSLSRNWTPLNVLSLSTPTKFRKVESEWDIRKGQIACIDDRYRHWRFHFVALIPRFEMERKWDMVGWPSLSIVRGENLFLVE